MIQLRLVADGDLAERTLDVLTRTPSVCNVVRLRGAAIRPDGDLIMADVAREDASVLVEELKGLGLEEGGTLTMTDVDATVSNRTRRAEQVAQGSAADAVVWEEVESRTSESTELSFSFVAFMVLATAIAAVGILTDSIILIIGAMVVGPEFGPLAGFCVAVVERQASLARRSLAALLVGFPVAIAGAFVLAAALRGAEDGRAEDLRHPETLFIAEPNRYSVLVALLAGVAGTLSLTTAKSSALMGVLISVATIPAAANVGVAAAYSDWGELRGALMQLGINLVAIMSAGTATLALQRGVFERRRERFHARLRRRRPVG